MKNTLISICLVSFCVAGIQAKTPPTRTQTVRPSTTSSVTHPSTKGEVYHPVTSAEVVHPTTKVTVVHPQTTVQVNHPSTQTQVIRPQTTAQVVHPQTTVQVIHPQTTVSVFHPQTVDTEDNGGKSAGGSGTATGGKTGASSRATTSMSDFKPKQAKDFTAPGAAAQKASPMGGGSKDLGNNTNQAEKDNANKGGMIGELKKTQNMEIDPKQTNTSGLEKLLEQRANESKSKKK